MLSSPNASPPPYPEQAATWLRRLAAHAAGGMPLEANAPEDPVPLLAALAESALRQGKSMWIVMADDQLLPELSNALDLAARPLCLVLPSTDFTARITLRASLSLLKSRLNRAPDPDWQEVWDAQLRRINDKNALWQAALTWSAAERADAWPAEIAGLFPVRIAPTVRALQMGLGGADLLVMLQNDSLPSEMEPFLADTRMLVLNPPPVREAFRGAIAIADKELQLRGQVEAVSRDIAELELELATARGEIAEFSRRYHEVVGRRMTELDALQAELALRMAARAPDDPRAKADAEEAQAKAEQSRQEERRYREAADEAAVRFTPSADVKKLFRQVAQKIHPDRARDEADRAWRTKLMAEANRAYRSGDAATLQEVLGLWQEGHPAEALLRTDDSLLLQQLEKLRARFAEIQRELDALYASRLYELFQADLLAQKRQRDLLAELAAQLDAQIAVAEEKLERLSAS